MGWIHNLQTIWKHTFVQDVDGLVKSRRWVFVGNLTSNALSFLVSQSFYTALLLVLFRGEPDSLRNEYLGRLAILQTATGFLQLFSPLILERMKKRKVFLMTFRWLYHFFNIVGLGVTPLLPFSVEVKATIFVAMATLMSVCLAIYSPGLSAWHVHSYGEETRSDYITILNMSNNVVSQLLYLLTGVFLDLFTKNEKEMTAVLIMRGVAVLFVALEGKAFWQVKEPVYRTSEKKPSSMEILTVPLRHPRYLLVALIAGMIAFSNNLSAAYYMPYLVDTAGVSYTAIGVISVLSVPLSLLVTPVWNRWIQRYGWYKIQGISLPLYYAVYIFNGLTTATTHSMYYIGTIYCTVVGVGMNLVNSNLPFMEAPTEGRSSCLAFYSAFGAAMGLLGSWLGKVFINRTEGKLIEIFGLPLPNVAYACFLTFFGGLIVTVLIWIAYALEKKEKKLQGVAV